MKLADNKNRAYKHEQGLKIGQLLNGYIFKLAENQDRCNILGDLEIGSDPTETLRVTCPSVKEQPLFYVFWGVTHLVFTG